MTAHHTGTDRTTSTTRQAAAEPVTLVNRYGKIGISAVAAAARYQGAGKNPAYAPASADKMFEWARDVAA